MPVWGWVLLVACLSVFLFLALFAVTHRAHKLPEVEPLHGDPENIAAPLPLDVTDALTERELEAEREAADRDSSLPRSA
jgi:hypothetical protein